MFSIFLSHLPTHTFPLNFQMGPKKQWITPLGQTKLGMIQDKKTLRHINVNLQFPSSISRFSLIHVSFRSIINIFGLPSGTVDKNPAANAGATSSIPGSGRFHTPMCHNYWSLEPMVCNKRSSCTAMKSSPCSLQLEKASVQQWRTSTIKHTHTHTHTHTWTFGTSFEALDKSFQLSKLQSPCEMRNIRSFPSFRALTFSFGFCI